MRRATWILALSVAMLVLCANVVQPVFMSIVVYAHESSAEGEETEEDEAREQREAYTPPANRALLPKEKDFCRKNTKLVRALMSRQVDRSTKEYALLSNVNDQLFAYQATAGLSSSELDMLVSRVKKQKDLTESMIATLKTIPSFDCDDGQVQLQIIDFTDNLDNVVVAIRSYAAVSKDYMNALQKASGHSEGDGR